MLAGASLTSVSDEPAVPIPGRDDPCRPQSVRAENLRTSASSGSTDHLFINGITNARRSRSDGSERAALTGWCDHMAADEQPAAFGDASWFDDGLGKERPTQPNGLPPPWRHVLVLLGVAAAGGAGGLAGRIARHDLGRRAPPATSAAVEVSTLRVVPPMAGVVVKINGHTYSSRPDGSIPVAAVDRRGRAVVVGARSTSSAVRVTFSSWADGLTGGTRSLDGIDGPTVELGFVVSNRITVTAGAGRGGTISLESSAGTVTLTIGVATFVPAARAVPTAEGLAAQQITYTAATDDGRVAVFIPAPDAEWSLSAP